MRFKEFLTESVIADSFMLQYHLQVGVDSDLYSGAFNDTAVRDTAQLVLGSLSETSNKTVTSGKPTKTSWNVYPSPEQKNSRAVSFILEIPCANQGAANRAIDYVANWSKQNLIKSSDTDKLILSIFVKNIEEKFDPIKFSLFMGKEYINSAFANKSLLSTFGKLSGPTLKNVSFTLKTTGRLPENIAKSYGFGARALLKNVVVADGLEFAIIAGAGYQSHTNFIKDKVEVFVKTANAACDRAVNKTEYYDMFMKLISTPVASSDEHVIDEELDENLGRFLEIDKSIEDAWHHFRVAKDVADSRISFMVLLDAVITAANKGALELTRDEKAYLKSQSKISKISPDDLDLFFKNNASQRLNAKRILHI